MVISISTPIWDGRKVGIAENKMIEKTIYVDIEYKKADGKKLYPYLLKIEKQKALTYPTQIVRGVTLRIIPISDFEVEGYESSTNVVEEAVKKISQPKLF